MEFDVLETEVPYDGSLSPFVDFSANVISINGIVSRDIFNHNFSTFNSAYLNEQLRIKH